MNLPEDHQTASNDYFTSETCPECGREINLEQAHKDQHETNPPSKDKPGIDSAPQPETNADDNASGASRTPEDQVRCECGHRWIFHYDNAQADYYCSFLKCDCGAWSPHVTKSPESAHDELDMSKKEQVPDQSIEDIDSLVRDACSVVPVPKSEYRGRLQRLIDQAFRDGQKDCREGGDPRNHKYFEEAIIESTGLRESERSPETSTNNNGSGGQSLPMSKPKGESN